MSAGEQLPRQELPSFEYVPDGINGFIEEMMDQFVILDAKRDILDEISARQDHGFSEGMVAAIDVDVQQHAMKSATEALDRVVPLKSRRSWYEELSMRYHFNKVRQEEQTESA